jgi:alkylation response protein AidB-like acyl-CoA dehydrogenase
VSIEPFLDSQQREKRVTYRRLVDDLVVPLGAAHDRDERICRSTIVRLREAGLWGAEIPIEYGGGGVDWITYGLLNEEVGRACASVRNLLGVQAMVSAAIHAFGTVEQKRRWLARLASGECVAAFALTEPDIGSDAAGIRVTAVAAGGEYVLSGRKRWISFGQTADLILVFAATANGPVALVIEKHVQAFQVAPITGMLGFRGSMLAEIDLDGCRVPARNRLLSEGLGVALVASTGLNIGRYSTAWGAVGLARACLEASIDTANRREQFGAPIREHQLVQKMLADMAVGTSAARLLCLHAGKLLDARAPDAVARTSAAKYYAATTAAGAARDCVQLHGASGCSAAQPVERYLRDAKVLQIVEGTREIQQSILGRYVSNGRLL